MEVFVHVHGLHDAASLEGTALPVPRMRRCTSRFLVWLRGRRDSLPLSIVILPLPRALVPYQRSMACALLAGFSQIADHTCSSDPVRVSSYVSHRHRRKDRNVVCLMWGGTECI